MQLSGALALFATGLALAACAAPAPREIEPDPALLASVFEDRAAFRSRLAESCERLPEVDLAIAHAISIGAPIYNAGSPLGCYRIYEGASYKLLYLLGGECAELTALLRAGLAQAQRDGMVDQKAWTLRRIFDAILGEETFTSQVDEAPL